MQTVLQLCKQISQPDCKTIPGVELRDFAGTSDIPNWLDLRHRAFARQPLGVRQWNSDDFRAEFLDRWWWRPDWMWLAEAHEPADQTQRQLIGSVTLAMRGELESARPVVHWLMVLPSWRRRGVGRALLAHLEAAAWEAGHQQVWLETHAAWEAAARFYEALGYRPVQR